MFVPFVLVLSYKSALAQTGPPTKDAGLAQPPPQSAPLQSAVPQSAAPPYQLLRYDEDWSYLRDPSNRTDALDALKYIPLNTRGWYVSLGGEARIRYEYYNEFAFGAGRQDDNGYLLQRYLLHADFHLGPRVRFFVQLQSGIETGRNGGPRPTDEDRLDLHQAFIDIKLIDEPRQTLTVRLGRHEMDFGAGRLISAGEGLNVRRSFDGGRLIYHRKNWLINAQVDKLVTIKRGLFDDAADPTQTFWGVGATRTVRNGKAGYQFYYIGLDRKQGRFDQGVGREIRHTSGMRAYGAVWQFDYNIDGMLQWGSFKTGAGGSNIRAWAVSSDDGYTIRRLPLRPRLGLRADVTSGDRDPHDRLLQTFNPLFPGTGYSDTIGLLGASNSIALAPCVKFIAVENLTINLAGAFFWRESTRDGIYGINVSPLRTGQLSRARQVGTMPSIRFDWRLSRHWSATAIYSYFVAGRFLKETPPGLNVNYTTSWLTFRF
jgi:hypothetical protein